MESQQKKDNKWCRKAIRKAPVFVAGVVFAVFCFIAINAAVKPVESSLYCGTNCHEMETAYKTWKLSVHGANKYGFTVDCVMCHLPPKDDYFTHLAAKTYKGVKDMCEHYFGEEYDAKEAREDALKTIPNKRCVQCHSSLLTKPGSSDAETAHTELFNEPDELRGKCVDCHDDIAHHRQNKISSP